MAGDPTQTQSHSRRVGPALQEWYVVTGDGALRMGPGMTVGESASGALTLNDPDAGNQWVVFAFTEDGDPWAIVMAQDKALRVAGTTCFRHPLGIGTTIRLPNNTLYISRDIRMPRHSGTVIEVAQRSILERLVGPARETPADEPRPRKRQAYPPVASLQMAVAALAALILVGVVALLVPGGDDDDPAQIGSVDPIPVEAPPLDAPTELPAPPVGGGAVRPADRAAAEVADAVAYVGPGATQERAPVAGAERPDSLSPPVSDAPALPAPDTASPGAVTMRLSGEPVAPVVVPPVERRTVPPVVQADTPDPDPADRADEVVTVGDPPITAAPEPDVAAPELDPAAPEPDLAPEPDTTTTAELEEIAAASEAVVRELSRQRDLLAADLALAQGRLTFPPEENAYALYTRVLSEDPGSPEAMSGLQAVRRELVNRALAQLASNDLDGSRQTLQAAADAGVDAQLVANLRDEVDYRQEQLDAR